MGQNLYFSCPAAGMLYKQLRFSFANLSIDVMWQKKIPKKIIWERKINLIFIKSCPWDNEHGKLKNHNQDYQSKFFK